MSQILSFERSSSPDLFPPAAGRLIDLSRSVEEIFRKWGYLAVIPSLFSHASSTIRDSLFLEALYLMEDRFSKEELPVRIWYGGNIVRGAASGQPMESDEMGVECVGAPLCLGEAEVISMALEILKCNGIRDFRLVLGHGKILMAGNPLIGEGEAFLDQFDSDSTDESLKSGIDSFKRLTKWIREFGYKDLIFYDLSSPFSSSDIVDSLWFKMETVDGSYDIIKGRRRKRGGLETTGFSFDLRQFLETVQKFGDLPPSSKIDFLVINRKGSRKGTCEIIKVLREHGYSVALDYSDRSKEELTRYAAHSGVINLLIVGDEDVAINEVKLIDVVDNIGTKVSITEIFDKKSGFNKLLRYHKRLERDQGLTRS
ncbi:MAG: ATP phosphoribosyltransferase regulatory subunit [Deltaproteobacteria bacterium]